MYHKLVAYGFTTNSAILIHSYLTGRSQRVKIGSVVGDWMDLAKGTPQGSKPGPNLFNLFINYLLYTLPDGSTANFADDNTLYATHGITCLSSRRRGQCPLALATKNSAIIFLSFKWDW